MNYFRIRFCAFVFYYRPVICLRASYLVFSLFPLCCYLVVSTSAIDCLERLVPDMIVSSWTLKLTYPRPHLMGSPIACCSLSVSQLICVFDNSVYVLICLNEHRYNADMAVRE